MLIVNPCGVGTTKPAPLVMPFVCHTEVNVGIERTTTVTVAPPMSWSSSPDQQERIPRMPDRDEVRLYG